MPLHFPSGYDPNKTLENLGSAARWTLRAFAVTGAAAAALAVVAKLGPWVPLRGLPHKAFLFTGGVTVASASSLVLLTTQCASYSLPSPPGTPSLRADIPTTPLPPPPARPPSPALTFPPLIVRSHTPPLGVSLMSTPPSPSNSSRNRSPPPLTPSPPSSSSNSPASSPSDSPPPAEQDTQRETTIPVLGELKEESIIPFPGLQDNHYLIIDIVGKEKSVKIAYCESGGWKAQLFAHKDSSAQELITILEARDYHPYSPPQKNASPSSKKGLSTSQIGRKEQPSPRKAPRIINYDYYDGAQQRYEREKYRQIIALERPLPGSERLSKKTWRYQALSADHMQRQIDLRDEEGILWTRQFTLPEDRDSLEKVMQEFVNSNYTHVRPVSTPHGIVFHPAQTQERPRVLDARPFFETLLLHNAQAEKAHELKAHSSPSFCYRNGQLSEAEGIGMTFPRGASAQVRGRDSSTFSLSGSRDFSRYREGSIGMTIASEISLTNAEGFSLTFPFYAVLSREDDAFEAGFKSNMQKAFKEIEASGQLAGDVMIAQAFDRAFQESIRDFEDVDLTCILSSGDHLLFQNSGFSRGVLIKKDTISRLTGKDSLLTFAEKKEGDYLVLGCPGLWNRATTEEVGAMVRGLQPWLFSPDYQNMASTLANTAHSLDPDKGSVSVMVLQV